VRDVRLRNDLTILREAGQPEFTLCSNAAADSFRTPKNRPTRSSTLTRAAKALTLIAAIIDPSVPWTGTARERIPSSSSSSLSA
jgi:hypothetical protein